MVLINLPLLLAVRVGFRNIVRNKKRSIVTIFAVSFVTLALVFFVSLQLSAYDTSIYVSTSVLHGNIQVQKIGHLEETDVDIYYPEFLDNQVKLLDEISRLSGVRAVAPRTEAFGLFSSDERTYGAKVFGVNPDKERNVSTIPFVVKKGRFIESGAELVLGTHFANNLKVDIGSQVTMIAKGVKGEVIADVFTVVGIFESGLRNIDSSLVEIPLDYFQEIFNMKTLIHSLVIKTPKIKDTDIVRQEIYKFLDDNNVKNLEVHSWETLVPGLKQMIQMDMAIGSVFYITLLLVVIFTLLNTFIMAVLERKKEFAVMRALGAKSSTLSLMILAEGFILTILGIIGGIILGSCLVYYFSIVGFQIPGSEEIGKRLNLQSIVYPWVSFKSLTMGPALLMLISLCALFYPAREPSRIKPSEVLRL